MPGTMPAGWYPDPQGRAPARWWDGVWWTAWQSDGARQWLGSPPTPSRRTSSQDLPALAFVRTVFLPEAQRRGALAGPQVDALAGLTDQLAAEVSGPVAPPTVVAAPPGHPAPEMPPLPVAPPRPAPPRPAQPTPHFAAPGAHSPAGAAGTFGRTPFPAPLTAPAPAQPLPPVPPPFPAPASAPRAQGRLARWWSTSRLRLDTDLTVHGLTYLGVLLLFVGVFGLVAFAFGDVEPWLRPVAELAVAAVPFVAAGLLARSGARFVARAMVAVGGLILPVMVVTSTVDGFDVPPDLHGAALPLGAGLACAAIAVAYAVRVVRRPDSALGVMVAPVLWFAAGMGAVGLGRPVPRGEDVAVPGAAQVAVIALAVLATTWLARRFADRHALDAVERDAAEHDAANPPDAADPPDSAGAPALSWRAALATGALAAAPAGVVVAAMLALVGWAAEGWPLVPVVVTTTALALTVERLLPMRASGVLAAAWLAVVLRVLTVDEATPVLSEYFPLPGAALDAQPALLLVVLLVGVGLIELFTRRVRATAVVFAVVGWAVAVVMVLGALHPDRMWWGLAGALALTVWAPVRRVAPPPLPGAAVALDAIAVAAPVAVVAAVWQHIGGPTAGLLGAILALAVTPLARGRLRRGPGDVLWSVWWGGAVAVTVLASVALAADGLLAASSAAERAVVPAMVALVVAALVAGPGPRVVTVALATPVVWWLWGAVVEASGWGLGALGVGYAVLGLGAVVAAHLRGTGATTPPTAAPAPAVVPRPARIAPVVALAGYLTGVVALLAVSDARTLAAALGAATLAWLVTAVLGDGGRSPVVAVLDRAGAWRSLPWVLALAGLPATAVATLHAGDVVRIGDRWWSVPLIVAALGCAAVTRGRMPERLRPVLPWSAFAFAGLGVLVSVTERVPERGVVTPTIVALAALVLVAPLARGRHAVLVWTAWLTLAPLAGLVAWTGFDAVRDLGSRATSAGTLIAVGGLLAVGALLVDRAHPRKPRALPERAAAVPPFLVGVGQLVLGGMVAAALPSIPPPATGSEAVLVIAVPSAAVTSGVLLLAVAVFAGAIAGLSGVGVVGAIAALVAWGGARALMSDAYPVYADVGVADLLLLVALVVSLARRTGPRWARWDVPLAIAAGLPALVALAVVGVADRSAIYVMVGGLAIGTAVRLARLRVTSEALATVGSALVLLGAAWASRGWAVGALAGLAVAHTTLAALRESGAWRTARQWVGAVLAGAAWLVFVGGPTALGGSDQMRVDVTAVGAALVAVGVVGLAVAGRLERSWSVPWGSVGALLAVGAGLAPAWTDGLEPAWTNTSVVVGWWQVAAWALLAVAAVLAGELPRLTGAQTWRTGWRVTATVPVLAAVLTGLTAASATSLTRVTVLALVSLVTAVAVVVAGRAQWRDVQLPLVVLGVAALVLAAGFALAADGAPGDLPRPVLVAAVLAVAAVQAAAYGVAMRVLGLRISAPVLAWTGWAVYAADALGGVVAWYTIPVGLAMLAVVGVWRADRRRRGLPGSEPAVAALDLAGIGFLVIASFVAAFTQSVWHALVAAGIGVLVFFWAVLTRVRRRLVAGATIVLAGVVVAVVLPLVALVPAWGGAALWVAVAVVGLLVVLAATFLERGRAAVVGGRARLRAATESWE